MIALGEGAQRQKTPNEIALNILLAVLTLVFLLVVVTLLPFARYAVTTISIPVLIALLLCLIPTTIGALISSIGIARMDRLVQQMFLRCQGVQLKPPATSTRYFSTKREPLRWETGRQPIFGR